MKGNNLKNFRVLYNKLDELLGSKTKIQRHGSFLQKLNQFTRDYPSFSWLKEEIRLVHDLRNVIIHEEKYAQDIAVPTDSFLHKIKQIIHTIENPQTAIDIASTLIYTCSPADSVESVVSVMNEKFYSIVPVYEDSTFLGVFSERSLLSLVAMNREKLTGSIKNILDAVSTPIRESWDFIPKSLDVYKVQAMFHSKTFSDAALDNSRLGVLFVTKNGKKEEELQGIITPWDLSKIEQYPKTV